jgi:hypothetical protein
MPRLTITEQKLVEFARKAFGEFITQFLLAGLGEKKVGRRWLLTLGFVRDGKAKLKRRVQVITHEPEDGSSCLPRGRDPLVLLALLRLLLQSDRAADYKLTYDQEDVLKLLGWEDTRETRREIDEAVRRYFLMSYKWRLNRAELARQKLSSYMAMESIISESENLDREEGRRLRRTSNRVVFNPNFIERLKHGTLFDLAWDNVRTLKLSDA